MLIRFGYDITVYCEQPTPMVCLMEIHASFGKQVCIGMFIPLINIST